MSSMGKHMQDDTILVVDDEEGIRKVLGIALRDMGYKVHLSASGEEGWRMFKQIRPRFVLADIKMPGMDGIELLRRIKQENPETEVIMISGHGDLDVAIKSIKYDATDFITKPIDTDVLTSALKRAQEKIFLRKQWREYIGNRALYRAVINHLIKEDVMMIDASYEVRDINDTMLKRLGLKREEVIGRPCYEISHHESSPCKGKMHPCPLLETLKTGEPSRTTHIHRDKRDRKVYYSISCYPIIENGEVTGAIEISKDISDDINMQKRLMEQEKLASVGHLAAGVAHEINNPLTTILTTAMLIQEDMDPNDPNHDELRTITNETLRCRKIVSSLLDFARQSRPAMAKHDITAIVQESVVLTKKQAAFKDVLLEEEHSETIPPVYLDRDKIQQSLINLALNAIDATDGGGKVTFSSRFNPEDGMIEIAVKDTGKGIPEEDRHRIFDPFFTTKENGTGLGLAITHGIIQQHGGTIDVESEPGHGTTFRIRLPLRAGDGNVR